MAQVETAGPTARDERQVEDLVDPRAPRFGQAITALGLAAGITLQEPAFVYAIAAILVVSAVSGWRVDLYSVLWRRLVSRVVDEPAERESASPHRFAKLMGATFTALAAGLLVVGTVAGIEVLALAGYVVAAMVALLAAVAAAFDLCVGCRLYEQVAFFRRLGWV